MNKKISIKSNSFFKKNILLFILILFVGIISFTVSYSLNQEETIILEKKWSSDERLQVDPLYVFDNDGFVLGDDLLFIESKVLNSGNYLYSLNMYDSTDFTTNKTITIEEDSWRTYYMVLNDEVYYYTVVCDGGIVDCGAKVVKLDSNFEKEFESHASASIYHAISNSTYDLDTNDIIAKDENGDVYIYVGNSNESVKISASNNSVNSITLTDEQKEKLFYELNMIESRTQKAHTSIVPVGTGEQSVVNTLLNSYIKLDDNKGIYFGKTNDAKSKAYFEIVDSLDSVIYKEESDTYVSYSNPVLLDDYIIVKAVYDEGQTLGTIKSDLLVLDYEGNLVTTLKVDSYFNNLYSINNELITERIYVEGNCTSSLRQPVSSYEDISTYESWNADSCSTHHYYEKYVLGVSKNTIEEIIQENPDTSAFSVIIFVIISLSMLFIIKNLLNKKKSLES